MTRERTRNPGHPGDGATNSRSGFLRVVGWAFTMDSGGQILSLIVSFVLAGLLGPRTYGVAAMASVYVMFVQMVQKQGMAAAIIQRKDLSPRHLDTAFWLVVAMSVVLMSLSIALAGWWAGINNLPELQPIIVVLSGLVLIEALTTVQLALLIRQMQFRSLAIRTFIGVAAGGIAGLTGALLGWGVWALVAQQLTTAAVSLVVLWVVSGWYPRLRWSTRAARDLLGFSTGSFLSSVAVFANNRADVLMVGLFFGPTVVGIYQLCVRLVDNVVTTASRPIQTLALPELSPHQDDSLEFARRLHRLMRISAVLAVPVLGVLAGSAAPLIGLLGPDWDGAVAVLQVLCIVGLVRVIIVLDGPLLQALGRPFVQAGITWASAAFSISTFAAAGVLLQDLPADRQAVLVAAARAGIYGLLIIVVHVAIVVRFSSLTVSAALRPYGVPLTAAAGAAATGTAVSWLLADIPAVAALPAATLAGGLVAAAIVYGLQPDVRSTVGTALTKRRANRHDSHLGS